MSPSMEMDSPSSLRHMIFEKHDADGDGRLSRDEMAALVGAVNPSVHFTPSQVSQSAP